MGRQGISGDLEGKNNEMEFDQDLAGTSRDVEGSREKIHRASKFTKSSQVLRGTLRDVEGKSRELSKIHRTRGIFTGARREKLQHRKLCCYGFFTPV